MTAKRLRKEQEFRESRRGVTTPEDAWEELRPLLDEELSRLPEKYQSAIVLCDVEGKTKKEAAGQLRCPHGTLSSWLARGRRMLARRGVTLSAGLLAAVLSQNAASASLRCGLAVSTSKAATLFAAGQVAGSVAVSAKVAALTEGVLKAMLLRKLKIATAVLLVFGVLGTAAVRLLTDASTAAAQSPTAGPQVAAQRSGEGTVRRGAADEAAWREMVTMKHEHAITAIACSADWSVAGDERGNLFAWDTKTGKNRPVKGGGGSIDRLQFTADEKDLYTPDGKGLYVICGGRQGIARYFMKDNKIEGGYGFGGGGYLGVSADGEIWMEFFREGRGVNLRRNAHEFKMGKFNIRPNFDPNHFETVEYEAKVSHALVSADDKWLAVATKDGTLHIHDRASLVRAGAESHPQEKHTIAAGKQGVVITDVQFSADGQRIAVVRDDALAKIYDTAKGEEVATLKGHSGIVFAVAFSPDGKKVVTGGDDNTARVWDATTGKALATLKGHTDSVRCAAFDPSGEILVTGSADKTVKLWRTK